MKIRLLGLAVCVAFTGCGDTTDGGSDIAVDTVVVLDVADATGDLGSDNDGSQSDADIQAEVAEPDVTADVEDAEVQSDVGLEVTDTSPDVVEVGQPDAEVSQGDADIEDLEIGPDATETQGGADAADTEIDGSSSCLSAGYAAGERYSLGDNCNFCDCLADGTSECTSRTCASTKPTCTYDGVEHPYAVIFPATDGCNDCVCAASGLACTHRCPELPQEGAILMADLDEHCGDDTTFTGAAVLNGLPDDDVSVPFSYNTSGPLYPETLADTAIRVRVVYEGGYIVCRIPSPTQPAIDMEVTIEWITEDGAFDEGLHTYLRRNNFGFVDAWTFAAGGPADSLDGTYDPNCLDPNGFGFTANWHADGTLEGSVFKTCEADIGLEVGSYLLVP